MASKKHEPDYEFWSKLDRWDFKEAALLLNELDPLEYKHVKFSTREVPNQAELKEAYKTFFLFKKTDWGSPRNNNENSAHPRDIYMVAYKKDLSIPEKLVKYLTAHTERELEKKQQIHQNISTNNLNHSTSTNEATQQSIRERNNLLTIIGILVLRLSKESKRASDYIINGRINASKIGQAILETAETHNIPSDGIKSAGRKVTEAMEHLVEVEA